MKVLSTHLVSLFAITGENMASAYWGLFTVDRTPKQALK